MERMRKYINIGLVFVSLILAYFYFSAEDMNENGISIESHGYRFSDFCILNEEIYLVYDKPQIYRLINDTAVAQWGEYGQGPLKFRDPFRIKSHNDTLYISDLKNVNVQAIDSRGNYLETFPSQPLDEIFDIITDVQIMDFIVNENYVILAYGDYSNYDYYVVIINRLTNESWHLDRGFDYVARIDFNPDNNNIYLSNGVNGILYIFDINGTYITEKNIKAVDEYYEVIHDMIYFMGKLYVLGIKEGATDSPNQLNWYGAIYVFDSDLNYEGSIGTENPVQFAKSFDLMKDGREIIIMDSFGKDLYRLENPYADK